ncbi:DUF3718 domain-containing protein [Shewanella sp. NIFS-20-20]|uniref:DUF3718 domain-containing protein n=1 Tax=Shewanella sp. NIFS-20-20 TaxID=2853806 RepID=UPI001C4964BA|nr:DUF3718 domain-containing protein [Shewanella sp. NIFS-20-20]MBV7315805.1 DUF3718 domain-containing protein [Shewanella sp. NIFS-20-20]
MRVLPVTLTATLLVASLALPVKADTMLASNICQYVQMDDSSRLREKLKESRIKLRNIYESIVCDGESLLRFAMISGANDTGEFIAKRLSSSTLVQTESDGLDVISWADANGHGESPITAAIKARL